MIVRLVIRKTFLYPLKTSENHRFSDVFRSIEMVLNLKLSIQLQNFESLVTLAWDNFTVPLLSHGELGLIFHVK